MAPKNVLLLVADDLGKQLGCYGSKNPKTPNIDQLAAEGTRFTKAFASTASCSASRSTIYTGLHTHQNGQYGLANGRFHFTCFDHVESGPAILARHGYLTGIIGKVHVGPEPVFPWEVREESDSRDVAWVADRAGQFFAKANSDQRPFFLTVGYIDPHRDLTRAGFGNEDEFDKRVQRNAYKPENVEVPYFLPDLPGVRQEFANYYESINRLDQGVGMMLAELDKAGLKDDTMVIFMSDNGPPFINSKTTLYDAGTNLPLIIRAPDAPQKAIVNPNLISYVDILPTVLEWIGQNDENLKPSPRLGRSFLSILSSNEHLDDWGKVYGSHTFHEITNYWPTRYLRDRKYKYHRNLAWRLDFPFAADIYGSLTWEDVRDADKNPEKMVGARKLKDYFFRPAEELYDLESDPEEVKNLAQDPAHAATLESMRADLEAWQVRSEDLWLYRDGVSVWLNKHHLSAGLQLPDRLDLDVDDLDGKQAKTKAYGGNPWARPGRS